MERIGLTPGSEVGGYTIVAPLGSGGHGDGLPGGGRRRRPRSPSSCCTRTSAPTPTGATRLRREVVALQRLRHPAVAPVLDAEADSTEAFIVTELVDGPNLEKHVAERGPLGAGDLLELAEGLARRARGRARRRVWCTATSSRRTC